MRHPNRTTPPTRRCKGWVIPTFACAALLACGGGDPPTETADSRAAALLALMTPEEKLLLVHGAGFPAFSGGEGAGRVPGIARLGIPEIRSVDSSSGVSLEGKNATPLPSTVALAASWDTELVGEYASLIAKEARSLGYGQVLGGGMNLAREPRNGRNFEYLGEDPVLAGEIMAARTLATQSQNVIATLKHFAANQQETNRFASNSVIDERTLHELYLLGFEIATIKGEPGTVMCAYNLLNSEKACENKTLLTDTLKGRWGFKGVVQSDWFAGITDTARAANAGSDEEQPGSSDDCASAPPGAPCFSYFGTRLKQAVNTDATVTPARLDDMVRRRLRTLYQVGLMDKPPPSAAGTIDTAAGDAVAQKVAERSMVLLKNGTAAGDSTAVLPLDRTTLRKVVVIGGHADKGVISGGGSGRTPARDGNAVVCLTPGALRGGPFDACATWYKSAPLDAIRAKLPVDAVVSYLDGSDTAAAAAAAAAADVAIVVATQYQVEGDDLPDLSLPNRLTDPANQAYDQNALIAAVAASAKRSVVVLQTGSAVTMPWLNNVHAVLQAWYPGVKGGSAIANLLFGDVNPSAKLPQTFPRSEGDLPQTAISKTALDVVYSEGLRMGYRWFDAQGIAPLFAFGHGLSYTTFAYAGLSATRDAAGDVTLSFTLKNTGSRAGAEVAQIYSRLPAAANAPPQRLVAWKKVELAAGESRRIDITVPASRFAVWDGGWVVVPGTAVLSAGGSSRDAGAVTTSVLLERKTLANAR